MLKKKYKNWFEAGTDEAGRGCLAGPVTAAAIILPRNFKNDILNDSKLLSEKKRLLLKPTLENEAECFAVAHVYPKEIDAINILNASILIWKNCIMNTPCITGSKTRDTQPKNIGMLFEITASPNIIEKVSNNCQSS